MSLPNGRLGEWGRNVRYGLKVTVLHDALDTDRIVNIFERAPETLYKTQPGLRGFTRANLFRMRQFYETYQGDEKVVPLVRQLPWSHHLIILGQSKGPEEREFYLRLAIRERWSKRELERQFQAALDGCGSPLLGHLRKEGRRAAVCWTPALRRLAGGPRLS
jgi:hypothetical protein